MKYKTVASLLKDEKRWCQHHAALDADGLPALCRHYTAVRWCVVGAIDAVYGAVRYTTMYNKLLKLITSIPELSQSTVPVVDFNDTHSHDEVLALVRKAKI